MMYHSSQVLDIIMWRGILFCRPLVFTDFLFVCLHSILFFHFPSKIFIIPHHLCPSCPPMPLAPLMSPYAPDVPHMPMMSLMCPFMSPYALIYLICPFMSPYAPHVLYAPTWRPRAPPPLSLRDGHVRPPQPARQGRPQRGTRLPHRRASAGQHS